MIVYRGEHGPILPHLRFRSRVAALSFSSCPLVASEYAVHPNNTNLDGSIGASPRVYPVYLKIASPVIDHRDGDPFIELSKLIDVLGHDKAAAIARRHAGWIARTDNWRENYAPYFNTLNDMFVHEPQLLADLYFNAYVAFDDHLVVGSLKQKGYDGAIHGGNGCGAGATEYRVFSQQQIAPAFGGI